MIYSLNILFFITCNSIFLLGSGSSCYQYKFSKSNLMFIVDEFQFIFFFTKLNNIDKREENVN